jgi:carbonic anhydrase
MSTQILQQLLENNQRWARERVGEEPQYFEKLCAQQAPKYLWIGCSDSRVPANQITGLAPGEVFVHRNVANIVVHTDFSCLSVIQYAVEVLKVEHIIVCGHYGCGGVAAALQNKQRGLIDNWLRNIKDLYDRHEHEFANMTTDQERMDRLCELNVECQVVNVCHTTIVQNAWQNGQPLDIHGWCYRLSDGIIRDLGVSINSPDKIKDIFKML